MLCAFIIKAQTGNGIVAQINSPYAFTPTTVDSTTTIDVVFVNTVGAQQTLTFTGIAAPFSISSNSVLIGASDSTTIQLSFNPTVVGNFSDTLDFSGSIFGSGTLVLNGEGVQVVISTSLDTLDLGSITLGNSVSGDVTIYNTGTGTMNVSNITCSDTNVTLSANNVQISQGGSSTINVDFTPVTAGYLNASIDIHSNDPNNPIYTVMVTATTVSEISGNFCGTFYKINSPYTFVGDVIIPDTCSLIIEAGVTINLQNYYLKVYGQIIANGTSSDSIILNGGALLMDTVDFTASYFAHYSEEYSSSNIGINRNTSCYCYDPQYSGQTFYYPNQNNYNSNSGCYYIHNYGSNELYTNDYDFEYVYDGIDSVSEAGYYSIELESQSRETNNQYKYYDYYYSINGGGWNWFYKTWPGQCGLWAGANYYSEYPKSDAIYLNPSDNIRVKIERNGSGNTGSRLFINNFKLVSSSGITNLNLMEEDFNTAPNNWNLSSSASVSSGYLYMNVQADEETTYSPSIEVLQDGEYYVTFDFELIYSYYSYYPDCYFDFLVNGSTKWNSRSNTGSSNSHPNKTMSFKLGNYNRGDQITLEFMADANYNSNTRVEFKIDNIVIHSPSLDNSIIYLINGNLDLSNSNIASDILMLEGVNNPSNIDASILNNIITNENNSGLDITNSTLKSIITNGDNSPVELSNSSILNSETNGIETNGDNSFVALASSNINNNNSKGIVTDGDSSYVDLFKSSIKNNGDDGINTLGSESSVTLFDSHILSNGSSGIQASGSNSNVDLEYSFVNLNSSYGVYASNDINVNYSQLSYNTSTGLHASGRLTADYTNSTFNNGNGIYSSNMSAVTNCILWGNNNGSAQTSGSNSILYSSIQGLSTFGTGGAYTANCVDGIPLFQDSAQHLGLNSPCVDAGEVYEADSCMPYGLGGPRADAGMYGGPGNWFWGGIPTLDGSPLITSIEDSPQDQGGMAGVLFNASLWDNTSINNNVISYTIWRHFDVNGSSINLESEGNWEIIGTMPSNNFNAYAYSAPTLGDSNLVTGMFNSCFIVVANTADSSVYWNSNVLCGYSTDDMAPSAPIASAMAVANTDDVVVYWDAPAVPDYAYSNVISSNGFTSLGVVDTMTLDVSTLSGGTYTYGVVHFDVNGNASDTAWVTITLADNEDVIPLTAGWNLISTNKSPNNNDMTNIFSSLMPGNLVYVTAFNQGSSLYNPNGLPFLNTLTQFTDGYGYWVKVLVDDTLSISGTTIPATYKIPLNANWNLSGYMNTTAEAPSSYLGTLIANNNLVYCTGFNQGTLLFNPNGLPFLNTLNSMQRPFGYWIKVNNAVGTGSYRMANNEGAKFSPEFMFVNGTSNLESHVGSFVEVLNSANELVAKLEIVNGGYLMTTALYGDDPTTEMIEGLQEGEYLTFKFNGEEIYSSVSFNGNMELKKINLEFSNDGAWSIYPNPLSTTTTINYQLNTTTHVSIKLFDIAGRQIDELVNARQDASYYTQIWDATNFEKGIYMIELHINGTKITTERLIVQ